MPRFAANISTMFGEWDFPDRIAAAADAGFRAVECQWPYDFDARKLAQSLSHHQVSMILINAPAGDRSKGDVGLCRARWCASPMWWSFSMGCRWS